MRRKRHLSKEERELWSLVAGRTTPLEKKAAPVLDHGPMSAPQVPTPSAPHKRPISHFRLGSKAKIVAKNDLAQSIGESLSAAPVQMDHKAFGKMTRGKLSPEARLDLHGLTLGEAHPELIAFVLGAHADGKRLVLVITGKGKDRDEGGPIPTRFGILRHQVPQWLRLPPLSSAVLQVTPAHLRHGGEGAYYVYLRRSR